jgi:hypothetical protein
MMLGQSWPFQIECDTSKYASGAVLTQTDTNGNWHPCAFISKTFSQTKQNYEIYEIIRQRTTSDHPSARRMEILHPGITPHYPYPLWSQTWRTIEKHENWIGDKRDGRSTSLNLMSN